MTKTNSLDSIKQKYKNVFYPPEDKKFHFFFMDNFRTIIFALVVAMFIRTFFFEPFKIPSTSMVPTLRVGDFLFISRFDYGTKIPFTDIVINKKDIEVGDIVVFDKDLHNSGRDVTYIKRVIATAGDTVEFKNSKVILNGKVQPQKYIDKLTYQDQQDEVTAKRYTETLGNIKHDVMEGSTTIVPDVAKITIPQGYVVVAGDNRDRSYDSRLWASPGWGLVSEDEIRGKARFLFFSWDRNFMPRTDRIFNSLIPEKVQ